VVCGSIVESQREACARIEASACDLDRAVAQVEEGRVAYDGAAYGRCLERFAAAPACGEKRRPVLGEDDADCVAAAVGQVAANGSCGEDFGPFRSRECAGGRCFTPDCGGTCVALPGLGESCVDACVPELRCLDGTCRPFGAEGEPCSYDGSGCASGLYCRAGSPRVCARPLATGATCEPQADVCAEGYCPMFASSPACAALAAEGEPCEGSLTCQPGLYCPNATGATCRRQAAPGESCREPGDCLAPGVCNAATGLCELLPVVGEPCAIAGVRGCAAGWCDGAVCRPQVPNGGACTADDACGGKEAECVDGFCSSPWC
jgi:hypothetical protein